MRPRDPPDAHLQAFHNLLDAVADFKATLLKRRRLSLAEVAAIASRHGVTTANILSTAELSSDCRVDYAKGEVVCL
jgi:phage gp36-like protein